MQGMSNDLFLDDAENIRRYTEAFNHLRNLATDPPATTRLLTSLAKAF
nr:Scr1 family TA system antitoxin-like transcriptional regulator [Actinomadura oligospora]